MLLDAPTPAAWLETHLAARFDEYAADDSSERDPPWWSVADLIADDAALLRTTHGQVMTNDGVPAPAAATYLAGWIAGALADAVGFALATTSAGFVADVDAVRWRQHPEGWMDRVELGAPTVLVDAHHPWAGQRGVQVVADGAEVRRRTIGALIAVVAPVVNACHRLARVGKAGLWNEVGDALGMPVAHQAALPALPAVVDTLAAAVRTPGAPWKARPDLRIVHCAVGPVYVAQKGGCCLAYTRDARSDDSAVADDSSELDADQRAYRQRFPHPPGQPRYCSTCTFRDWSDTAARQLFWLERQHAGPTATHDDDEARGAVG